MENNLENLSKEEVLQKIETEIDKCPSVDVCAYIKNHNQRLFCIEYVYKQVNEFGASISVGIGRLESYLDQIK